MKFKNTNALWSAVFLQTLRNCGVRTLVVSPGSRSTPLAAASAGTPHLEVVPVLDERSAAFFALGLAKSTARPVALVCTSGTALANYLPAVVEARMSRTPLVVVSADRPPELQNCHAGQTIPQVGIFSKFPVWERCCVPGKTSRSLAEARDVAVSAAQKSAEHSAPVHVNVQFREPLAPSVPEENFPGEDIAENFDVGRFCSVPPMPLRNFFEKKPFAPAIDLAGKKILIVAGTTPAGQDDAFNVDLFSRRHGAPILADATHPLRHFPPARERLIERYDAIFKTAEKPYARSKTALRPDVVLQIGTLPESKFLRAWLASLGETPVYLFNYCGDDTDALRRPNVVNTRRRFREIWNDIFSARDEPPAVPVAVADFLSAWRREDASFKAKSDAYFKNEYASTGTPTEPQIARFLCENLPESETALFVANGMPVRDLNAYCPAGSRFWVFHNRGANGIDGTLSTALGVAHGCMEQTILYTGDLSLLHDTNGFLSAPQFCGNLCIVLQNNAGGNIFRHLPVARENPHFERLWLMPQRVSFERLASAYGVDYARAGTLAELGAHLARFRSLQGIHLIEILTDGESSRRIRSALSC